MLTLHHTGGYTEMTYTWHVRCRFIPNLDRPRVFFKLSCRVASSGHIGAFKLAMDELKIEIRECGRKNLIGYRYVTFFLSLLDSSS